MLADSTCREMSKNVEKCREMSSFVESAVGGGDLNMPSWSYAEKKITSYCVPRGTKKSVPYVTVTIWAMEILKEGFKNNNMVQIHPRLLGHNNY